VTHSNSLQIVATSSNMLYIQEIVYPAWNFRMYDKNNSVHVVYFEKINASLKELGQESITGENERNLIVSMLDLHAPVQVCVSNLVELRSNLSKK